MYLEALMIRLFPRLRYAALSVLVSVAALAVWASANAETIKVGVTAGPHAQVLEIAKKVAATKGLDIKIVEFSDYIVPNAALAAGDLEANSYQNQPFLDQQNKDRGYNIVPAGLTLNFPLGIYSKKYKTWAEVPNGAQIAIQNDPTNGGRSLLLLQDKGVIKLKNGVGFRPTILDIVSNPKKLRFTEIDAAQTPRSLDDVDAAAVNTNFAIPAGLNPQKDALLMEDPKGPYVNFIAIRAADKDKPWVKTLVESYQSPEVKAFVETKFQGAVLASW
jgi:D-methionine transport system substrate-binding protein